MKIEEGKFYITRDGRKVGPISKGIHNYIGKIENELYRSFYEDGTQTWADIGVSNGHHLDLVAEWHESPPSSIRAGSIVHLRARVSADGQDYLLLNDDGKMTLGFRDAIVFVASMPLEVNDRVRLSGRAGYTAGTIIGIYGEDAWVLPDTGIKQTFPLSDLERIP